MREWAGSKILLVLGSTDNKLNITKLSRKTDLSYTHTVHVVRELCSKGLVNVTKNNRENLVVLTDKGRQAHELVNKLLRLL